MADIDPTIPIWPLWLEPEHVSAPTLQRAAIDGPAPLGGAPQSVTSGAGTWQFQLIDLPVFSEGGPAALLEGDRLSQWRALYNGPLGNGEPVYMRFFDYRRGPRARAGLDWRQGHAVFADRAKFSDGSDLAQGAYDVVVSVAAQKGANTLRVEVLSRVECLPGDLVGIGGRLHQLVGIWPVAGESTKFDWKFAPILRSAVAAGDRIEVGDPLCPMVLKAQDRSQILRMERGLLGRQTLTFIEAPWA